MENEHKENLNYAFLSDRKVKELFGKIDYALRGSVHIQREYPKPEEMFRFIDRNFESLREYYSDIFQLSLNIGGNDFLSNYYYIDFDEEGARSKIPSDHRYRKYMETSYIIVGMLFLKMYKLDANFELDSILEFNQLLLTEYEEERNGLLKLLASSKNEKSTDYLDKEMKKEISDAFNEFAKLGWIVWLDEECNRFKYMPSFERLRKIYQPQILTIDDLIKKLANEK